jgi:CRISPR-associated protein Cas10/Csm1 subtype III-A
MGSTVDKSPASLALAALLRGTEEFLHRGTPEGTVAETLSRFTESFPWIASEAKAAGAAQIAIGSFDPQNASERMLEAWRYGSSEKADKGVHAQQMHSPLSTVFRSQIKESLSAQVPFVRLRLNESILPTNETCPADAIPNLAGAFRRAASAFQSTDLVALTQNLLAALETFAWCVPAAEDNEVSIFELSRSVAATAAALTAQDQFEDFGMDPSKAPLMLAVGDLGGIQQFLYTIVTSKAARMLRGRSLAIQLIADAVANQILSHFELPVCNLLYSGGGKLWLLMMMS